MDNTNNIKIIGICGFARAGKDTAFLLLNKLYPESFVRFAFADALKDDLRPFVQQHFGKDIYLAIGADKEALRPLMIDYGCAQRHFNPDYWVEKLVKKLEILDRYRYDLIPVICDMRFPNEAKYFKDKYGDSFKLIEIERPDSGAIIPMQELENHPKLKKYVDFKISWPSVGEDRLEELEPEVRDCYNYLFTK